MASPNNLKELLMEAGVDLINDTVRIAFGSTATAYTFNPDAVYVNDVFDGGTTAQELTATNYSRQTLSGNAVTQDDTDDEGVFDANDVTFSSLDDDGDGDGIQFIMLYKQVGTDDTTPGDDPIIAIFDDDSAGSLTDLPLTLNGSDVVVSWAAEGIINIA